MRTLLPFCLMLIGCPSTEPAAVDPCADAEADGAMTYAAGLTVESELGHYTGELVDALPAPPDTGENVWTLRVEDESGAAVPADGLVARPFMPEHGHGTNPAAWDLVDSGDGDTLLLEGMDLIMPGIWRITIEIPAAAGQEDEIRFWFCAEG